MEIMKHLVACLALVFSLDASAQTPIEPHHRMVLADVTQAKEIALTLDACGGRFDADLIALLVALRIPATLFVTKKWLDRNPVGAAELLAHPELFDLEDHGSAHVPATVGTHRHVYGILGSPDMAHVQAEVSGGAQAIAQLTGRAPRFYRGAAAVYDLAAIQTIEAMGYRIAGFSVNADVGATLSPSAVAARLRGVKDGDIIIAHMNKPASGTAKGFATALPELLARGLRFVKLAEARLLPI
jgi:peptidoglycan/xylan/chitin deacetylase (PgdA/CDA1 family)